MQGCIEEVTKKTSLYTSMNVTYITQMKLNALLILISSCTFSYTAELSGKIANLESTPVSGAKIIIFNEISISLVQRVFTDRNGIFKAELPPGSYLVWVTKDGFHTHFEQVILPTGKTKKQVKWQMYTRGPKEKDQEPSLKHILRHAGR